MKVLTNLLLVAVVWGQAWADCGCLECNKDKLYVSPEHSSSHLQVIYKGQPCGCHKSFPFQVEVPLEEKYYHQPLHSYDYKIIPGPAPIKHQPQYSYDYKIEVPLPEYKEKYSGGASYPIELVQKLHKPEYHQPLYSFDYQVEVPVQKYEKYYAGHEYPYFIEKVKNFEHIPEKRYAFDYQVEVPVPEYNKNVFLLNGLTAKMDKIVLPAPECPHHGEHQEPVVEYKAPYYPGSYSSKGPILEKFSSYQNFLKDIANSSEEYGSDGGEYYRQKAGSTCPRYMDLPVVPILYLPLVSVGAISDNRISENVDDVKAEDTAGTTEPIVVNKVEEEFKNSFIDDSINEIDYNRKKREIVEDYDLNDYMVPIENLNMEPTDSDENYSEESSSSESVESEELIDPLLQEDWSEENIHAKRSLEPTNRFSQNEINRTNSKNQNIYQKSNFGHGFKPFKVYNAPKPSKEFYKPFYYENPYYDDWVPQQKHHISPRNLKPYYNIQETRVVEKYFPPPLCPTIANLIRHPRYNSDQLELSGALQFLPELSQSSELQNRRFRRQPQISNRFPSTRTNRFGRKIGEDFEANQKNFIFAKNNFGNNMKASSVFDEYTTDYSVEENDEEPFQSVPTADISELYQKTDVLQKELDGDKQNSEEDRQLYKKYWKIPSEPFDKYEKFFKIPNFKRVKVNEKFALDSSTEVIPMPNLAEREFDSEEIFDEPELPKVPMRPVRKSSNSIERKPCRKERTINSIIETLCQSNVLGYLKNILFGGKPARSCGCKTHKCSHYVPQDVYDIENHEQLNHYSILEKANPKVIFDRRGKKYLEIYGKRKPLKLKNWGKSCVGTANCDCGCQNRFPEVVELPLEPPTSYPHPHPHFNSKLVYPEPHFYGFHNSWEEPKTVLEESKYVEVTRGGETVVKDVKEVVVEKPCEAGIEVIETKEVDIPKTILEQPVQVEIVKTVKEVELKPGCESKTVLEQPGEVEIIKKVEYQQPCASQTVVEQIKEIKKPIELDIIEKPCYSKAVEKPVQVDIIKTVEYQQPQFEKIVEVQKPGEVEITKTVECQQPYYQKIVEIEQPVELEYQKPYYGKTVEVHKPIEVEITKKVEYEQPRCAQKIVQNPEVVDVEVIKNFDYHQPQYGNIVEIQKPVEITKTIEFKKPYYQNQNFAEAEYQQPFYSKPNEVEITKTIEYQLPWYNKILETKKPVEIETIEYEPYQRKTIVEEIKEIQKPTIEKEVEIFKPYKSENLNEIEYKNQQLLHFLAHKNKQEIPEKSIIQKDVKIIEENPHSTLQYMHPNLHNFKYDKKMIDGLAQKLAKDFYEKSFKEEFNKYQHQKYYLDPHKVQKRFTLY